MNVCVWCVIEFMAGRGEEVCGILRWKRVEKNSVRVRGGGDVDGRVTMSM